MNTWIKLLTKKITELDVFKIELFLKNMRFGFNELQLPFSRIRFSTTEKHIEKTFLNVCSV